MRDHRTDDDGKLRGDLIKLMEYDELTNRGGVMRAPTSQERAKAKRKRKTAKLARKTNRS